MATRLAHSIVTLTLASAVLFPLSGARPDSYVPGRLLVQFRAGVTADRVHGILSLLGARSERQLDRIGVHVVELPGAANESWHAQALRARPEVEFAELDRAVAPDDLTPNDPYFSSQWQLNKVRGPAAWSITTGNPIVTIAIADTGVDATHPDLASKMVPGWNVYDNNSDTHDVYGHGSKVAGTAAALSNNGVGVSSVAWNCRIMPVRISQPDGYAYFSAIASGVTWAADHGARVVNVSYNVTTSSTVTSAAKYLNAKGGVLVSSAGNDGAVVSSADNPNILTIGATDGNDLKYSWSNSGNNIDLAAPGCVTTTTNGGGYGSPCGTSFSSPMVAGAAALVMSASPSLTAAEVTRILQQSADDLGAPGWDPVYGWGRLNVAAAVTMAASGGAPQPTLDTQPPSLSITAPAAGAVVSGMLSVQASATDDTGVTWVSLSANGSSLGTRTAPPYTFAWDTAKVANGSYTLLATAADAAGNRASKSVTVTVSNVTDTTPPVVSITYPTPGATVSGITSVLVNASDNVAVTRMDLFVDGALTATSTQPPFSTRWNTKNRSGSHNIYVKAYDRAGNASASVGVTVTVSK